MKDPEEPKEIWTQVLKECSTKSYALQQASLLILGDRQCGKAGLIRRIQAVVPSEEVVKGIALDYSYMDVCDDGDDLIGRFDFWRLEGDASLSSLLSHALNESNVDNSGVLICLDFSRPWDLLSSLRSWLEVAKAHVTAILEKAGTEIEAKNRVRKLWQNYKDVSEQSSEPGKDGSEGKGTEPLPEGALATNIGVPIFIVCCKVDASVDLKDRYGFKDGHFEYIQTSLRKLSLEYGASLIYTSAERGINCELLSDYLKHCFFSFPFKSKAQVIEKDSIFVPIGWDSMSKISLDFSHQKLSASWEEPYESILKKPELVEKREREKTLLLEAESDQAFLLKHKTSLALARTEEAASPAATPAAKEDPAASPGAAALLAKIRAYPEVRSSLQPTVLDFDSPGPAPLPGTPIGAAGSPATPGTDDHQKLAEFFNSLIGTPTKDAADTLTKKTDS